MRHLLGPVRLRLVDLPQRLSRGVKFEEAFASVRGHPLNAGEPLLPLVLAVLVAALVLDVRVFDAVSNDLRQPGPAQPAKLQELRKALLELVNAVLMIEEHVVEHPDVLLRILVLLSLLLQPLHLRLRLRQRRCLETKQLTELLDPMCMLDLVN